MYLKFLISPNLNITTKNLFYTLFGFSLSFVLVCVWLVVTSVRQPTRFLCPWNFSRQEYWSGLLFPIPGDLSEPETEPMSLASPTLAGGLYQCTTWEAWIDYETCFNPKDVKLEIPCLWIILEPRLSKIYPLCGSLLAFTSTSPVYNLKANVKKTLFRY